jgi:hypothetical protein
MVASKELIELPDAIRDIFPVVHEFLPTSEIARPTIRPRFSI